ncbi:Na+/sulfate transporter [Parabacteroides distasonis]|jgi:putative Na+/sulphate transporter|uniref:Putative Na+/sulphate transporter n=1 Tax=Parabacteroides distasonis (strain ATCC 8503 / DSM 20701 / CIP 104284 / JCM 5825 / NCTC 11152) TaxID=435591 RepID=A6L9Q6_PARD8|nr:SLC13 family permease [Parabacteroides distasonis]ABR42420.1 putative Na+/sulphate transporter [Parabacteroides distasonis ATCC 8503]PNL09308.1 SLC13 family permease [Parabacteroides distasonis]QRO17387.1 SLC13 family permease [Parabacteroides distasonis]UEB11898.1 SLC13 family permease [Parabacteroides distasonis]SUV27897.1 Na+/sulfate transporter [Parabacteroides distasonis]
MITTLIILALSAVFFVNGKLRSDLVALCALVLLIVFNILTPEEALSGFSNPIVIMMVGLFVVGGAIFKTGLAKMISSKILRLAGKSELKLFILIMMVTAFIGAFVSNTGTVALMLPIVVSMAASANISPGRFLMPLAFASSMGGMATLIGTPPNLVVDEVLSNAGFTDLSFFSFTPIGVICVLIGLVVLIPLSKFFLVKKEDGKDTKTTTGHSPKELAKKYQLSDNLYRIQIRPGSRIGGKKLQELNITQAYNLSILEIRRQSSSQGRFLKTVDQSLAGPHTELQENDILYVFGPFEKVNQFAKEQNLELTDTHVSEYVEGAEVEKLSVREIGIAEVLLMPDSKLINKVVKDSGFRDKYSVNILGIQRKGEYILNDIKDIKMHAGDILLIQGTWDSIARMSQKQSQWVVLGQPLEEASKVTLDYKAPVAALIMVLMIAAMVFDFIPIPPVAAVIIAGILMVLTGCFRNVEEAYKTINWESVVLIAAMLPMSLALEKTGASNLISEKLVSGLGDYGPLVLMTGIYFTTSLLTMFISNTATAVLVAPIALQSAIAINVSPYPFLLAVTVGASMCFASPFSTPPNALVMSAGKYTFMDYVKVGLPLQIVMGIVMVFILPLLFPF